MLHELSQEIEKTARAVVNEIHTAIPGKIDSFNTDDGTAKVKPIGKYVTSDGKELDYPMLTEVPVVFPVCQQEGIGIAFPVKKGDSCLIIIFEVELDEWRSRAKSEGPLRFDLTSAVAIPGLIWKKSALVTKAVERNALMLASSGVEISVLKDMAKVDIGTTVLEVSKSGLTVGGNLTVKGNISCSGTCSAVSSRYS